MTVKTARRALAVSFVTWLTNPPGQYALDVALIDVYRYTTAPDPDNAKPYQIVVGTERSQPRSNGVDESDLNGNLYAALFARINVGDEATKETAEDWLDDCEAYLLEQMEASRNQAEWLNLTIQGVRRDPDPQWYKLYRVSYIRIGAELK